MRGVGCALGVMALAAAAALPASSQVRRVSATDRSQLEILGVPPSFGQFTALPTPLAGAGDVNGDGLRDLVVGAPDEDPQGRRDAGAAYVVFGRRGRARADVRSLGSGGFRIEGAPAGLPVELDDKGPVGERAGETVTGVGDVNGDGLDDIAVGAPRSSAGGRPLAGAVYVVFGRRSSATIDLGSLGSNGYRIVGPTASAMAGTSVGGAGDVNGDGRPDVVLSGPRGAWVAFGKAGNEPLDLASSSAQATRIAVPQGESLNRFPVAGAGDANGDGFSDVVIGVPELEPRKRYRAGAAYIVFGAPGPRSVGLSGQGFPGYRIDGEDEQGFAGEAVAGAGDVNGDGLGDVLIGAPDLGADGSDEQFDYGAAYVVFGRRGPGRVDLGRLGAGGLRVRSEAVDTLGQLGSSVTRAGDVNGDGLTDVALGAPGLNGNCRRDTGAVYVVYGRRRAGTLSLDRLGRRGFRIDGPARDAGLGASLASLADATGDGRPDLLAGGSPRGRRAGPPSPRVLTTAAPPRAARAVPAADCLKAVLVARRIRTLLRTGRMTLRVTTGEVVGRRTRVGVGVAVVGRRGYVTRSLTNVTVRFSRPGTRTVRPRLTRLARRFLQRRRRVRLAIFVVQNLGRDDYRFLGDVVTLRR